MAFVMMATTMKVATGTEEIVVWELLKTTTGVLFVLVWTQMEVEMEVEDVDLLNGRVMVIAMMTTIIKDVITMEVNSWHLNFS